MKNLSVNTKLILLVCLGLVFVGAVVVIETISNSSIKKTNAENFALMERANSDYREKALFAQKRLAQIQEALNAVQYARIAEKSYFQFYNPKYAQQLDKHVTDALDMLKKIEKNQFTETLVKTLKSYQQDFGKIIDLHKQIESLNASIMDQFKTLKELLKKCEKLIISNRFEKQMAGEELSPGEAQFATLVAQSFRTVDFIASMRSQYLLTDNTAYIDTLVEHFKSKMKGQTAAIRQSAKSLKQPVYQQAADTFKKVVYSAYEQTLATQKLFVEQKQISERLNEYGTVLTHTGKVLLNKINEQMNTERIASVKKVERAKKSRINSLAAAQKTVTWILVIALGAGVVILILLAVFIIRSITKPINTVIVGLKESAGDVTSGAGHISMASESLAEGASEQAASLEETSASLEEISSMTKQNADNARQADGLMGEAKQIVGRANDSMGQLANSMKGITKASEETSKIIKTIDEIAFQTNLLALNAAVEAARAGEAGAGFAVVADEVRNLAMRASEAAKNTSELIEGTTKKVIEGSNLAKVTNEAFGEVAVSAGKVGELVSEIAAASNEQAQGIEQVNTAVSEMEKVTQNNAANAEESASASEEMSAQAEKMNAFVDDLVTLVGGKGGKATMTRKQQAHERVPAVKKSVSGKVKALGAPKKKEKNRPEDVLPLDEDNFSDF